MGRIKTVVKEVAVPLENETDHSVNLIDPHTKFPVALRGASTWFQVQLSDFSSYREILLEAYFDYTPSFPDNRNEYRQKGRVGIWTASKDVSTATEIQKIGNTYQHGDLNGIELLLNDWDFGHRSKLSFKIQNVKQEEKLQFALCAIPFFNVDGEADSELTLKLSGTDIAGGSYKTIDEQRINFRLDRMVTKTPARREIEFLAELGAFSLEGSGNSVHPKQLYTIRYLKKQVRRVKEPISLAYIGTDTTENLRSLIRAIKNDDHLSEIVETLQVYCTEDWDLYLFGDYEGLEIDENCSDTFEIQFKQLPSNGSLPEDVEAVDYVLSTYVTPWAVADDQNTEQYKNLIFSLLGSPSSRLISVDPSTSEKAIRSTCRVFNLQHIYEKTLQLDKALGNSAVKSVVDCKIWKRRFEVASND